MRALTDLLQVILPVFTAIALGRLCRVRGILTADIVAGLRYTAVNLTLPAVSLITFAQADYSPRHLLVTTWIFLACVIALGLGKVAQRMLKIPGELMPFLCTAFEGGMLGYSLYPLIYGDLSPLAVLSLGQILFIYTVYKARLSGARSAREVLGEMARTPALWTLTIGLTLGVSGLYRSMESSGLQVVFDKTVSFVSAPTSFMILLSIGYDLDLKQIEWSKVGSTILARLTIMALLLGATLALNHLVFGGIIETSAALMLFTLPAPMLVTAFTRDRSESGYAASALSIMTLITGVVFVVMAIFKP